MAKPIKSLELHYPMIQFLIIDRVRILSIGLELAMKANGAKYTKKLLQLIFFKFVLSFCNRETTSFKNTQKNLTS